MLKVVLYFIPWVLVLVTVYWLWDEQSKHEDTLNDLEIARVMLDKGISGPYMPRYVEYKRAMEYILDLAKSLSLDQAEWYKTDKTMDYSRGKSDTFTAVFNGEVSEDSIATIIDGKPSYIDITRLQVITDNKDEEVDSVQTYVEGIIVYLDQDVLDILYKFIEVL